MSPRRSKPESERLLIAIAVVPSLFFLLFPLLKPLPAATVSEGRNVLVLASAGELGGFKPSVLKVVAGERLNVSFWAMDVGHSFNLPQLNVDLALPPGETRDLSFETGFEEDAGEYRYLVNGRRFSFPKAPGSPSLRAPLVLEFKCNRYCSPAHWGMRGQLVIDPPAASSP